MTTTDTLRFFGPFEALHALELPNTAESDLYEGFYAGFYDSFTRAENWDVPRYEREARAAGGRMLELACGSGRIAVPLARSGVEVVGLELGADMLKVLAKRLEPEPAEVRARVVPVQGDMTDFDLGERFGLIVLGATSICLLHTPEARERMFAAVARHLRPDGRFLFDFTVTTPEILRLQDAELVTVPAVSERFKRFTMIGRRWDQDANVQIVNFYSEIVAHDGATRRFLSSTEKAVLDRDELVGELERAGLALESEETVLPADGPAGDRIDLLSCRPAA
jgi:SAM-dependent methyltransferase